MSANTHREMAEQEIWFLETVRVLDLAPHVDTGVCVFGGCS